MFQLVLTNCRKTIRRVTTSNAFPQPLPEGFVVILYFLLLLLQLLLV